MSAAINDDDTDPYKSDSEEEEEEEEESLFVHGHLLEGLSEGRGLVKLGIGPVDPPVQVYRPLKKQKTTVQRPRALVYDDEFCEQLLLAIQAKHIGTQAAKRAGQEAYDRARSAKIQKPHLPKWENIKTVGKAARYAKIDGLWEEASQSFDDKDYPKKAILFGSSEFKALFHASRLAGKKKEKPFFLPTLRLSDYEPAIALLFKLIPTESMEEILDLLADIFCTNKTFMLECLKGLGPDDLALVQKDMMASQKVMMETTDCMLQGQNKVINNLMEVVEDVRKESRESRAANNEQLGAIKDILEKVVQGHGNTAVAAKLPAIQSGRSVFASDPAKRHLPRMGENWDAWRATNPYVTGLTVPEEQIDLPPTIGHQGMEE